MAKAKKGTKTTKKV